MRNGNILMKSKTVFLEKLSLATGWAIPFGERDLWSVVQKMMKMESVAHIYEKENL